MKHLFLLAISALFFFSCEEIAPTVTGSMGDTGGPDPTEEQKRQVLIEEFTGVRCVNCPAGSALIQDLLGQHGHRLIAVSIHSGGDWEIPLPESNYDFSSPEADEIQNLLGPALFWPTATVNRTKFEGQFGRLIVKEDWPGFITQELAIDPKVKIAITPSFNSGNRNLDLEVKLFVQENILEDDVRLSVYITENDIEDAQKDNSGIVLDYVHKHVFRDAITNPSGDLITESLAANAEITKNFSMTVPADWVADNCEVVAFVSLGGADKNVLQAHQVHLVK